MKQVTIPISDETIRNLKVGDPVLLSGVMVTGRDAAHKWMVESFIKGTQIPTPEDETIYKEIKPLLERGVIYHCGPVVAGLENKDYKFVAAGPTTSTREEPYQGDVMRHFNLKGVVGKGGMGAKTLAACQDVPGVYFHAVGGAATLIAKSVEEVLGVYKYEFGVPEAMWIIRVRDFPAVVTMDAHGASLHAEVYKKSRAVLEDLLAVA
ncbi:MAG: fumarate hydratase C-terminal domain-containing protein [Chloroflexota bacterium]|nr:MAG: fumarate hydratase C-terminal domain-containing protein [Chloroflexota bacterium]